MTWSFASPDGRATFEFVRRDGELMCRWRRVGDHSVFQAPLTSWEPRATEDVSVRAFPRKRRRPGGGTRIGRQQATTTLPLAAAAASRMPASWPS
jgi:hypothetical protein